MPIGINYSVLYIDYVQKVKNKVIPYCFHTRPQHLHNLTQKCNVLHINGKEYAKENEDLYRFGLKGWLYSNKQISYQGQPEVIGKSNKSSSYIKHWLRNVLRTYVWKMYSTF